MQFCHTDNSIDCALKSNDSETEFYIVFSFHAEFLFVMEKRICWKVSFDHRVREREERTVEVAIEKNNIILTYVNWDESKKIF